ncbi:hypothetical protein MMC10_011354 [Thelotrema lepadinum]|nr:hypothetical protein [Thelotrema lepadinum]
MRVLVIGASGRTGKLVVDELLSRGHKVNALVRKTSSLEPRSGLTLIEGTPTAIDDVRKAMRTTPEDRPSVVIVTMSAPRATDSPFAATISPPRLMADSNANVVTAMIESKVQKVVIMQAFGVGDSWPNMHFLLRLLMKKSNMSYQFDDHNSVDKEVRASKVNFVMVRPSRLEEGDAKPVKLWPENGKGVPMMGSITRSSVALWLVDAAEKDNWDGTAPVITN